ncbi:MAG: hypothetical protein N3A63_07880 [Bacteroidetes bacterium]|nr:hypothetical protein [Bacteroidota bacterium]
MKQKRSLLHPHAKQTQSLQRKLIQQRYNTTSNLKNPKLVKVLQSVTAGHIRGGHSYH